MDIILIAATTVDGFIARNSHEITNWTLDLGLFKEQTMGSPIIMGSHTFKTLPKELHGRDSIVFHRNHNPEEILNNIKSDKCYVIGGGITNARFAKYLTHIFITPHPFVFGKGVPLFSGDINEVKLMFEKVYEYDKNNGVIQYQYKIIR